MLKKYADFINESIQYDLILESDIKYSDKFKKVLSRIGDNISTKLLSIENQDKPIQSNYFDLGSENDNISFTPDRKVKEILDKLKDKWIYKTSGRFLDPGNSGNKILFDNLSIEFRQITEPPVGTVGTIGKETISPRSGKKFVEFIPDDKEYDPIPVNIEALSQGASGDDINFFIKNRQTIKVGRGVRALLNSSKVEFTDKEIEDFVNKYKATIDQINDIFSNFEIVDGDDISYWYDYVNYERGTDRGTLGSSCMAMCPPEYFEIYTANPDKVSLVIYRSPDNHELIRGRALVWKIDTGESFMDRIYTHEDSDVELFRQFATKNGFYYKKFNGSSSSGMSISPKGDSVDLDLTVTLHSGQYDSYPYLDTLKYYNPKSGKIKNIKKKGDLELEDTDGNYLSCDSCGGEGSMECEDCYGNGTVDCSSCDGSGNISCDSCGGEGRNECENCGGDGEIDGESCPDCTNGHIKCSDCNGKGNTECGECEGSGNEQCVGCRGSGSVTCGECS